jgi:hypothetical protein
MDVVSIRTDDLTRVFDEHGGCDSLEDWHQRSIIQEIPQLACQERCLSLDYIEDYLSNILRPTQSLLVHLDYASSLE